MNKLYSGVTETEGRSRGVKAQRKESDLGDKYVKPQLGRWSLLEMFYLSFHWSLKGCWWLPCVVYHLPCGNWRAARRAASPSKNPLIKESKKPFSEMRLYSSGMGYLTGKRDIWITAVSTAFPHKHKLLSLTWVVIWIWCDLWSQKHFSEDSFIITLKLG